MFRAGVLILNLLLSSMLVCAQSASTVQIPDSTQQPSVKSSQLEQGVPPDSTSLVLLKMVRPDYPLYARQHGIQGQVKFKIHISETGDVEKVEAISGDGTLMAAAIDAAKKWKFKPYIKDGKPAKVVSTIPYDFAFGDRIRENVAAPVDANSLANKNPDGTIRVKVPQGMSQGLILKQVVPVYPELARASRIQGQVVFDAVISKEGRVSSLKVHSGHPMLIDAARGAVQQWRYRPYTLNGKPVEVETQIVVNFTLR